MNTVTGASLPYMAGAAFGLAVLGWSQMGKQDSVQPQDFARTPSFTSSPLALTPNQTSVSDNSSLATEQLMSEVSQLREHVATLVEHQSLTQEDLDGLRDSMSSEASVVASQDSVATTPEEEAASIESRFARMDAFLEHESPDPEWGGETRASIEQSLDIAELSGATLLESTCGATLCKVKLNMPADLSPEDGLQRLATQRSWDGATMFRLNGSGEVDFYIARVGHDLPMEQ